MKNMLQKTFLSFLAFTLPLLSLNLQAAPSAAPVAQTASDKGEVTIYVTRHGKTLFNAAHRAQGWSDTPLTAAGVEVAEQLGRGLKEVPFAAAYPSDSGRARETAKLALTAAGQPLPVTEDQRLRETFFGSYEGELDDVMWEPVVKKLGFADLHALTQALSKGQVTMKQMMNTLAELDPSHTTENAAQVHARMQAALHDIAQKVSANGGGNELIVSHGMAIMAMLEGMTQEENLRSPLQNASVTVITYKDGKFTVGKVGDMQFVEKGKQP
ncbi:histidine phosphatase family protein [Rahnella woolbedingensis]|uniref:phosphoglycerate mutase (2,3-diphosphoglycerate-dependent) n=1 Tax=Rahnella woolbedingensis TaxID=1510574 RepID=A0A419NFA5_9GAMM|nr:histidine phosphatase family protein [Rahnella woolbedingensis]RJT47632.1 histidine phosphatase family protein [Rahnella woolbedingensis]